MDREARAEREELLAAVEETTEHQMHAVARFVRDTSGMHRRARKISERARAHLRRARLLRGEDR